MMECTSSGSTLCARADCSTIVLTSPLTGAGFGAILGSTGFEETTTLRTSFPVFGSARTTCVWRAGAGTEVLVSAARLGEAASMAIASKKQIYTILFDSTIRRVIRNESINVVIIFS